MSSALYTIAGNQALHVGDIPAARAHLEAAAQAMEAIGENSGPLSVNLGWVLRQESDPHGARSMFDAGLRTARRNGNRPASGTPASAWRAWPRTAGPGTGQVGCTAPRRPFSTGRGAMGEPEARYRRESLDDVRAFLGDEQLGRAYAEGMALSVDEALDLAAERLGPA